MQDGHARHSATQAGAPSPGVPFHSASELRDATQALLEDFSLKARAAGLETGPAPAAEVRTTPYLIHYRPAGTQARHAVVLPWWADLTDDARAFFARFTAAAEGRELFHALFHRFLVPHEAAHWLQADAGLLSRDRMYQAEIDANRVAAAYWRTVPGGEAFLARVEQLVTAALALLSDPVPTGIDPETFFDANYLKLAEEPAKYAYFQFRWIAGAIREQPRPTFGPLVLKITGRTPQLPPAAAVRPVVDEYHGSQIVDPYRWLEDAGDPEVSSWLRAQADHTRSVLDSLPGKERLEQDLLEVFRGDGLDKVFGVQIVNGHYYSLRLPGREDAEQFRLYVRPGLDGADRLLVDPERLPGGEDSLLAIHWYSPSPDNRYVVFATARAGSEDGVLHILDAEKGELLQESTDRGWLLRPYWTGDSRSFYYVLRQQLPEDAPAAAKTENSRVYLHEVGRPFQDDPAVFGHGINDDGLGLGPRSFPLLVTHPASRHILAAISHGTDRRVRVYTAAAAQLENGTVQWRPVAPTPEDGFLGQNEEHEPSFALHGDELYWLSRPEEGPARICMLDLNEPEAAPRVLWTESGRPITHVHAGTGMDGTAVLYWVIKDGGMNTAFRLALKADAEPEELSLPWPGSVIEIIPDIAGTGVLLHVSAWDRRAAYLSVPASGTAAVPVQLRPVDTDAPQDGLTTVRTMVESHDGTEVPLTIIHRSDLALDSGNPVYLFGYGAYGISMEPAFNPTVRLLLDRGLVFAVAHVRGGGELGTAWHHAGRQAMKPNTWLDFIACAEYLVNRGYTNPQKLVGAGGSAGGILIGRAIQERPDLFAAALALVPMTDVLRFEMIENGPPNIAEFGTVTNESGFRALLRMSPYANVREGTDYPALLITTGINDARVTPWMAAKFAARMQAASTSGRPVLLRVDYDAGHGPGSGVRTVNADIADIFAFTFWQTGHPDFQPGAMKG